MSASPPKKTQFKKKKKAPVAEKAGQSRPPPEDDEEEKNKTQEVEKVPEVENKNPKEMKETKEVEKEGDIYIVPDAKTIVPDGKTISLSPPPSLTDEPEPEPEPEEKKGFPHSLGPFGIKQTTFRGSSFNHVSWGSRPNEGGMFFMEKQSWSHNPSLKALGSYIRDWPVVGQFSPAHPVTLTVVEKEAALIPRDATSFVWSYPVAIQVDPAKAKGIDFTDPDVCFLLVGGYVYFNGTKIVCGVNTIIPASTGLQFSKPKKWNPSFTRFLMKDGRFQSITIKALNDCGAWYFAWIRPDEPIFDEYGMEHKLCPNGGFVYLFHRKVFEATPDELDQDCYFHVLSGEEYKAQVEREARYAAALKSGKKPNTTGAKSVTGDKPGQKSAAPLDQSELKSFPLVGMIEQLHDLMGAQAKLGEDRKRVEQEEKEVVDSAVRKLVFLDKPINSWTIEMVGTWLDSVEFHSYKETFRQQMVDGETLLDLDEKTIKTLVQEYHIKKLLRCVDRLRMQQQANQAVRKTIEDQKSLQEKIEELKSQIDSARTCVLCIDEDKNTKFNCGHVVACANCAKKLKDCPVCRVPITKREVVYLS